MCDHLRSGAWKSSLKIEVIYVQDLSTRSNVFPKWEAMLPLPMKYVTLMKYLSNGRVASPVMSLEKMWVSSIFPVCAPIRVRSRLLSLFPHGAILASSSMAGR